jgi:hypothetical protein
MTFYFTILEMFEIQRQNTHSFTQWKNRMDNNVVTSERDNSLYHHTSLGYGPYEKPSYRTTLPNTERFILSIMRHTDGYCVLIIFVRMGDHHCSLMMYKDESAITLGVFQLTKNDEIFISNNNSHCVLSFMNVSWTIFNNVEKGHTVWYTIRPQKVKLENREPSIMLNDENHFLPCLKFDMIMPGEVKIISLKSDNIVFCKLYVQGMKNNGVSWYGEVDGRFVLMCTMNMFDESDKISLYWFKGSLFAQTNFKKIRVAPFVDRDPTHISFDITL